MNLPAFLLCLALVPAALASSAGKRFSEQLPPEHFKAAGLDKLTPAELAVLDQLVSGETAQPSAAPTEAARGEGRAAPSLWVRLLPGTRVDYRRVETRLAEPFRGWQGRTVFRLENGQTWRQVGGDTYATPPMPAPRVWIEPGALGSFWLRFEGVNLRVRVEFVR